MADRDLDRSEAAKTGEARVPGPGQDRPPRVPRQQPPSGTRDGSSPEVPGPQPELPDAFAPGLPLSADADPALDGAGAEPSDAGDPYGPPGDLDTADPYDPGSYGLGALGLVGDDYDTGDEYPPPDNNEAPGQDSPLSLIRNFGRHPGQRGAGAPRGRFLAGGAGRPGRWPGGIPCGTGFPVPPPPQPQPHAPPQPQPAPAPSQPVTADSLTTDLLLPGRHKAPAGGWRRAVFKVTGGLVRAPESAAQRRRQELIARALPPSPAGITGSR